MISMGPFSPFESLQTFFKKRSDFGMANRFPNRQGTTVEDIEKPIVFKISAWAILTTCNGRMDGGLKQQPPRGSHEVTFPTCGQQTMQYFTGSIFW